ILVVDDDALLRRAICAVLLHDGYDSLEASTGACALELCTRTARIDLVLSDVEMPEMDGISLARHLGQMLPRLPVVLMSGTDKSACVLAKPFTASQLRHAIETGLARGNRTGEQPRRRRPARRFGTRKRRTNRSAVLKKHAESTR